MKPVRRSMQRRKALASLPKSCCASMRSPYQSLQGTALPITLSRKASVPCAWLQAEHGRSRLRLESEQRPRTPHVCASSFASFGVTKHQVYDREWRRETQPVEKLPTRPPPPFPPPSRLVIHHSESRGQRAVNTTRRARGACWCDNGDNPDRESNIPPSSIVLAVTPTSLTPVPNRFLTRLPAEAIT